MTTDSERIAILETKTAHIEETVKRVDANVDSIQVSLSKQRGFMAGVMFIIAPIGAILAAFAKEVWQSLAG